MNPTPALLIDHLWQSSVAGLALLALLFLSRALSARTRRILAWIGLVQLALPAAPLLGWLSSRLHLGALAAPAAAPTLAGEWLRPVIVIAAAPARRPELWGWAAAVWASGFAGLFGLWLLRGWRFRRSLLATSAPLSAETAGALAAAARRLGLRRALACREADPDFGPGVLGWIRPVVILPRGLRERLTAAEFDAILIHELVHVRRRDSLLGLLQALLVSAFWFNPVAWLLQRTLRAETERSCDESVLAVTADPDSYANGILKALRHSLGAGQPAFAGALGLPVASRLKAILATGRRPEGRFRRGAALGAGLALAAFSGRAGSISGGEHALPLPTLPAAPLALMAVQISPPAAPAEAQPSLAAAVPPAPAPAVSALPTPHAPADRPASALLPAAPAAPAAAAPATASRVVLVPVQVSATDVDAAAPPTAAIAPAAAPTAPLPYELRQLDQQPVPLSQARPRYPYAMRKGGYRGNVVVEFLIYADGTVHAVKVLSSTQPEFNDAATEAVSKWLFKPGRRGGRAVITRTQVTIEFTLSRQY